MGGVFDEAYSTVDEVNQIVVSRIDDATTTSQQLTAVALDTITALSHVNIGGVSDPPPSPPDIDPTIDIDLNLSDIVPTSFGEITSNMPQTPGFDTVPMIAALSIPDFVSSIDSINIPEPPPWTAPADAPVRPQTGDVTIPDEPILAMPTMGELIEIVVPEFEGLTIPYFDATAPEFEGTALPGILQWAEPTYHTQIIDEVIVQLQNMWAGGSGIPEAVERAMVERAMSREDYIAQREIDSVAEEFSLRGFSMPTGMEAARADQLRETLAVKKLGLNRELTIKFAETQIENIRFACTTAIAAENVYVNIFNNMAQRMFEAAKFQVESQINIYNAQVSLFNARMNGFQIRAAVFDTLVKAELTKIEVFKAEIEAELARGQLNEQKVRVYTAQIQAVQTAVEIYKARMQGASIQADVIRNQIEAYRADVQAYAERIGADKVRFDAYESQVKGEAAKAGIIDAEARAYAAMVSGKSAAADIDIKRADIVIQKNKMLIDGYIAELEAEKSRVQSQLAVIQSGAQAYTANTQRYIAQAGAETAKAQVIVTIKESEMRTNIAFYQAQVQAHLGEMEQLIRKASIIVDALKAAGGIASTLAAGAMAGVHVGATLSGGANVGASGAYQESTSNTTSHQTSESHSVTETHTYEGT